MEGIVTGWTHDTKPTTTPESVSLEAAEIGPTAEDYDYVTDMSFCCKGVVIFVGLVCNLLAFAVIAASSSLRRTTTGHYLLALAVADALFMVGEILRWLNTKKGTRFVLGVNFMHTYDPVCKFTYYLRYSAKLTSAWITVIITGERLITIASPLKVSLISTPKKAKMVIVATYILWFVVCSYPFWTVYAGRHKGSPICTVTEGYPLWNTVVLGIASLVVPGVIVVTLTALILFFLARARASRRRQLGQYRLSTSAIMEQQLTAMLLSVAIAFVVMRAPYTVAYYLRLNSDDLWPTVDPWMAYRLFVVNKVTDIVATANYAINFFLYCFCGSTFRARLVECLCCQSDIRRSNSSRSQLTKTSLIRASQPTGENIEML